jgi:low affinity Fe/Cu permease
MTEAQRFRSAPASAIGRALERGSQKVSRYAGSSWGFSLALLVVIVWAVTGPLLGFSEAWQLTINTFTTIVTFLMVFLIQRAQNKDALALQVKLNEIVASIKGASNRLIDVEDLSEDELRTLEAHYRRLAEMARAENDLLASHSIEEAEQRHLEKAAKPGKHKASRT